MFSTRNLFTAAFNAGSRHGGWLVFPTRRAISLVSAKHKKILQYNTYMDRTNVCFIQQRFMMASFNDDYDDDDDDDDMPVHLYQEWTLEQDKMVWENQQLPLPELASLLGRGVNGVASRLLKLKDVNSKAYERFFSNKNNNYDSSRKYQQDELINQKQKLVPVSEVLRRVQWDYSLPSEDFSILHYDRVDDVIVETCMNANNDSIGGSSDSFIEALPEHRIVAVKYKERIVWDREKRIDLIFGGDGIQHVMDTYNDWKAKRDAAIEWNKQRQEQVSRQIQQILGIERFDTLKQMSSDLLQHAQKQEETTNNQYFVPPKTMVEKYVKSALQLFQQVRQDPSSSLDQSLIPMSDYLALDCLSELVALLPDSTLRPLLLQEIYATMNQIMGSNTAQQQKQQPKDVILPELNEDELTETFVRGQGPGGQKINKTSNRVILVHEPTQLRVECQETRSLTQNRKLARKRLRLKLDEYLNGTKSKTSLKQQKATSKKSKTKAKNRARLKKKQLQKAQAAMQEKENDNKGQDDEW